MTDFLGMLALALMGLALGDVVMLAGKEWQVKKAQEGEWKMRKDDKDYEHYKQQD